MICAARTRAWETEVAMLACAFGRGRGVVWEVEQWSWGGWGGRKEEEEEEEEKCSLVFGKRRPVLLDIAS